MGRKARARFRATYALRVAADDPIPDVLDAPVPPEIPRWQRVLLFLGPFLVTGALYAVLHALVSERLALELLSATGAALLVGTAVIFGSAVAPGLHLTSWDLAVLVMYVNAAAGFFYAYNLDLLERVPRIGPVLVRARQRAHADLESRPWIRRLATAGVALFVVLPLPGSGSFGGCITGRILGLTPRRCFVTVSIAGAVVAIAYAYFGQGLEAFFDSRHWGWPVRLLLLLVVLGLAAWLVRWVRRLAGPSRTDQTDAGSRTTSL